MLLQCGHLGNFYATLILREIDLADFGCSKTETLTILESLNFDFWKICIISEILKKSPKNSNSKQLK